MLRVITLHQPYATLMMLGLKTNETRNRRTKVTGTLGIHAAAHIPNYCKQKMNEEPFKSALKDVELPTGCILGTVELVSSWRTENWIEKVGNEMDAYTSEQLKQATNELQFGDYSEGRWAWLTVNPLPFDKPIPAKGSQGFWFYKPSFQEWADINFRKGSPEFHALQA